MIKTHRNRNWNVDRRLRIISGKPELRPAHKSYAGIRHSFLKITHGEKTPRNARLLEAHLHNYIIQWKSSVKRTESFLKLAHRKILFVHFFCCRVAEVSNKYILDYFMKEALLSYIMLELSILREPDYRQNKAYKSALRTRLMRLLWTIYSKYHLYLTGRSDPIAVWEIISRFLEHELPSNVPDFFNQILEDIKKNLPPVPKHPMLPYYTKRFKKHEPIQLFEEAVDALYRPHKSSTSIQIGLNSEANARIKNVGNRSAKELDELEVEFGRELTNRLKAVQNRKPPDIIKTSTGVRHTNLITRTNLKANSTICLSDDSEDESNNGRLQIYRPPNDVIDLTNDDDDVCEDKNTVSQQPIVNDELRQCLLNQAKSLMSNFQILAGANEVTLRLKDGQFELDTGNQRFTDKPTPNFRELDASVKNFYEVAFRGCQDALNQDYCRQFQSIEHPLIRDVLLTSMRNGPPSALLHPGLNLCIADKDRSILSEKDSDVLHSSRLEIESFPEPTPLERSNSLPQSVIDSDRVMARRFHSLQETENGESSDSLKLLPVDFSVQTLGTVQNLPLTSPSIDVGSTALAKDSACNTDNVIINRPNDNTEIQEYNNDCENVIPCESNLVKAQNTENMCSSSLERDSSPLHIGEQFSLSQSPNLIDQNAESAIQNRSTAESGIVNVDSAQQWVSPLQAYEDKADTIEANMVHAPTNSLNGRSFSPSEEHDVLCENNSTIQTNPVKQHSLPENPAQSQNSQSAIIEEERVSETHECCAKNDLETDSRASSEHNRQIDEEVLLAESEEYHGTYNEIDEDLLLREENENCHSLSKNSDSKANNADQTAAGITQSLQASEIPSTNDKESNTENEPERSQSATDNATAIKILSNVLISPSLWKVGSSIEQTNNVDLHPKSADFEWCPVQDSIDNTNRISEEIQNFEDPLSISTNVMSEPLCSKQDNYEGTVQVLQPSVAAAARELDGFRNLGDDQIITYVPGCDLYTHKQLIIFKEESARERGDPRKDIEAAQNSSEITEQSILNLSGTIVSQITGFVPAAQRIRPMNGLFDQSKAADVKMLHGTANLLGSTMHPLRITSASISAIQKPMRPFSQQNIETIDHSIVEPTKVPNSYLQGSQSCPDNKLMELAGIALQYENRESSDNALQRETNIDSSDSESKLKIDERCSSPEPTVETWNEVTVTRHPVKKRKPGSRSGSTRYRTKAELKCMITLEQSNNSFSEDDTPLADRLEKGFQVYSLLHEEELRSNKTTSSFKPAQRGRPRLGKRGRPLGRKADPSKKSPTGSTYTAKLRSRSQSTNEKDKEDTNIAEINTTSKSANIPNNNDSKLSRTIKSPVNKIKRKSGKVCREISEEPISSSLLFTSPHVPDATSSKDPLAALPSKKRYLLLEKKQPFLEETTRRLEERFFTRNDDFLVASDAQSEHKEKIINEEDSLKKLDKNIAEEDLSQDDLPLSQLKGDNVPITLSEAQTIISSPVTEKPVVLATNEAACLMPNDLGTTKESTIVKTECTNEQQETEDINMNSFSNRSKEFSETTNNGIKAQVVLVSETTFEEKEDIQPASENDQNPTLAARSESLMKLDKAWEEATSVLITETKDDSKIMATLASVEEISNAILPCIGDELASAEVNLQKVDQLLTVGNGKSDLNNLDSEETSLLASVTKLTSTIIEENEIAEQTLESRGQGDLSANSEVQPYETENESMDLLPSSVQSDNISRSEVLPNEVIIQEKSALVINSEEVASSIVETSRVPIGSDLKETNDDLKSLPSANFDGVTKEINDECVTKDINSEVGLMESSDQSSAAENIDKVDRASIVDETGRDDTSQHTGTSYITIAGDDEKINQSMSEIPSCPSEVPCNVTTKTSEEFDCMNLIPINVEVQEICKASIEPFHATEENIPELTAHITEKEDLNHISEISVELTENAKPEGESSIKPNCSVEEASSIQAGMTAHKEEASEKSDSGNNCCSNEVSSEIQVQPISENASKIMTKTERPYNAIFQNSLTTKSEDIFEVTMENAKHDGEINCSIDLQANSDLITAQSELKKESLEPDNINDSKENTSVLITKTGKLCSENTQNSTTAQSEDAQELTRRSLMSDGENFENNCSNEASSGKQLYIENIIMTETEKPCGEVSQKFMITHSEDVHGLRRENDSELITETLKPRIEISQNSVIFQNKLSIESEKPDEVSGDIQPNNEIASELIIAKPCSEINENSAEAQNTKVQELAIESVKSNEVSSDIQPSNENAPELIIIAKPCSEINENSAGVQSTKVQKLAIESVKPNEVSGDIQPSNEIAPELIIAKPCSEINENSAGVQSTRVQELAIESVKPNEVCSDIQPSNEIAPELIIAKPCSEINENSAGVQSTRVQELAIESVKPNEVCSDIQPSNEIAPELIIAKPCSEINENSAGVQSTRVQELAIESVKPNEVCSDIQPSNEIAPELIIAKPCSEINENSAGVQSTKVQELAIESVKPNEVCSDIQTSNGIAPELIIAKPCSEINENSLGTQGKKVQKLAIESVKPNEVSGDIQPSNENAPELIIAMSCTEINENSAGAQNTRVQELAIKSVKSNEVSSDIQPSNENAPELIIIAKLCSEINENSVGVQSTKVQELAIESVKSNEVSSDIQPSNENACELITIAKPYSEIKENSAGAQSKKVQELAIVRVKPDDIQPSNDELITETAKPCSEINEDSSVDQSKKLQELATESAKPDGENYENSCLDESSSDIQPSKEAAPELVMEIAKLCNENSSNSATAQGEDVHELTIETKKLDGENSTNHSILEVVSKTEKNSVESIKVIPAEETVELIPVEVYKADSDIPVLCDYVCEVDVHSETNTSEYDVVYGSLYESLKHATTSEGQMNVKSPLDGVNISQTNESDVLVSSLDISGSTEVVETIVTQDSSDVKSEFGSSAQENFVHNQHPVLCDYVREVDVHSENHSQEYEDVYKRLYESLNMENSNGKELSISQQDVISTKLAKTLNEDEDRQNKQDDSLFRSYSDSDDDSEIVMDPKCFRTQRRKDASNKQFSEDPNKTNSSSKNFSKASKKASRIEKRDKQVEVPRKTRSQSSSSASASNEDKFEARKNEPQSNKPRGRRQASSKKEEPNKGIAKENIKTDSAIPISLKKSRKSTPKVVLHENETFVEANAKFPKRERFTSKPIETIKPEKQETDSLREETQRRGKDRYSKKSDDGNKQKDKKQEQQIIKSSKKAVSKSNRIGENEKRASRTKQASDSTEKRSSEPNLKNIVKTKSSNSSEQDLDISGHTKELGSIIAPKKAKHKPDYKGNSKSASSKTEIESNPEILKSKIKDHNVKSKKNNASESGSIEDQQLITDRVPVCETRTDCGNLKLKIKDRKGENASEQKSKENNKLTALIDDKKSLDKSNMITEIDPEPSKPRNLKAKGELNNKKSEKSPSSIDDKKPLPISVKSDMKTEIEHEPSKPKNISKVKDHNSFKAKGEQHYKKNDKLPSLIEDEKLLPILDKSDMTTEIKHEPPKLRNVSKIKDHSLKAKTDDISELYSKKNDRLAFLIDDQSDITKAIESIQGADTLKPNSVPRITAKLNDTVKKNDKITSPIDDQKPSLAITKDEETKTKYESDSKYMGNANERDLQFTDIENLSGRKIKGRKTKRKVAFSNDDQANIPSNIATPSTQFKPTKEEETKALKISKNVEEKTLSVILVDLNKSSNRKRKSFKYEESSVIDATESTPKKPKTELTHDMRTVLEPDDVVPGKRKDVDSEIAQSSKRVCMDPLAFHSEEAFISFEHEFIKEKNDQYNSQNIEVTPGTAISNQIDLGHAMEPSVLQDIPKDNLLTNPDYEKSPIIFTKSIATPAKQSAPESEPYEIEFPDFFGITETVVETTSQQMFDFGFDSVVTTNSSPFSNSDVQLEAFQTQFNSIYQENSSNCITVSSVSTSLSQTSPYQTISVNDGDFSQFCTMTTNSDDQNCNDHSYADGVETVKNFQINLQGSPVSTAMPQQTKEQDHNSCMASIMMQANALQYSNITNGSNTAPLTVSQNSQFNEMYQSNSRDCIAVTTVPQTIPYQTIAVSSNQNLQHNTLNSNTLPQPSEDVVPDLNCTMDSMISGTLESDNVLIETTLDIGDSIDNISGSLESDVLDETNWQQPLELLCLQTNNSKHKAVIADIKSLDIIDDGTSGDFESDLSGTSAINPMVSELLEKKTRPIEPKKPEKIIPVLDISRRNPQREKLRPPPRKKDFQPIISGDQNVRVKPMHELLSQTVENSPKHDKGKSPRLFLHINPEDNDILTKTNRLQAGKGKEASNAATSMQYANNITPLPQNRSPESPIRLETRRATREYQQALIREQQEAKAKQSLDPFDQIKKVPTNPLFEKRQKGINVRKTPEPKNVKKGKSIVKSTEYVTYSPHQTADFVDNHDDIRWPPEGNSPKHRNTSQSGSFHEPSKTIIRDPHVLAATSQDKPEHLLQTRQKDSVKNSANKGNDDQYDWLNKFPRELEKRGRSDSIGFQGNNYST